MKVWTEKMTESNIKGPIIYNKVLKRIATGRDPAAKNSTNDAGLRIAHVWNQVDSEIRHEFLLSGFCFFANDKNKICHANHKKTEHHIEHIANV